MLSDKRLIKFVIPPPGRFRTILLAVIIGAIVLYVVLPFVPDSLGQAIVLLKSIKNEIGAIFGAILIIAGTGDSIAEKWQNQEDPEPQFRLTHGEVVTGVSCRQLKYDLENPMTGSDIKELQNALNANNYAVKPDGIFGPETDKAVRSYQRDKNLAEDGIVGPIVRANLGILYIPKT